MAVQIDMDMPKICADCPMFVKPTAEKIVYFQGQVLDGKCKVLPVRDYSGRVVAYQTVSTIDEIKGERRSCFCPLKEVKK